MNFLKSPCNISPPEVTNGTSVAWCLHQQGCLHDDHHGVDAAPQTPESWPGIWDIGPGLTHKAAAYSTATLKQAEKLPN